MKIKPLTDYPSSYFSMRFVIALCLCLTWATSRAQDVDIRLQFHSAYMPQFTVREASDNNVQPIGIRLTASNYNLAPWEAGIHAYGGYDDVRSEEHTSELQSRFDLVCRLLLEKKNIH